MTTVDKLSILEINTKRDKLLNEFEYWYKGREFLKDLISHCDDNIKRIAIEYAKLTGEEVEIRPPNQTHYKNRLNEGRIKEVLQNGSV